MDKAVEERTRNGWNSKRSDDGACNGVKSKEMV